MGMNALVFNVLKEIGIRPERFSLQWASAAEAPRFVKLITEFTGKIKALGPLGEAEGIAPDELQDRLQKGLAAVSSRKVRMVYGNTAKTIRKEGIFTQEYINGVIEEKLNKAIVAALSAEAEEEEKPASEKKEAAAANEAAERKAAPVKGAGKTKPAPAAKKAVKEKAAAPKKEAVAVKSSAKKKTTPKKKK